MVAFSAGTQQMIELAMSKLSDQNRVDEWQRWRKSHDHVRSPGEPLEDETEQLPSLIAGSILTALENLKVLISRQQSQDDLSEDEVSDLDNDLSLVKAIESMIYGDLRAR